METSSVLNIYRKLQKQNIKFVDYSVLRHITGLKSKNSLYKLAYRMEQKSLLLSLNKTGKFLVADSNPSQFEIANFLYRPSYVSLESALSFYGVLAQFVYSITSVSTKKTQKFIVSDKEYVYSRIKKDFYWGYEKKDDFLIALPEKALLDSLYFFSKGLINLSLEELDLSSIDKKSISVFQKRLNSVSVDKLLKKLKL